MPDTPDAILLCGGAGLRLRSIIGGAPKGMANVAGRPFLELPLRQLDRHGFERAILAVGYRKNVIQSHFGERAFGLRLAYSHESSPLGTGGALRNAFELVRSESIVIMNGDSYTNVDLGAFLADYKEAQACAAVVVVSADGRRDCGSVLLDGDGKLVGFEERWGGFHASYINAGIYVVSRQLLHEIPSGIEISLEHKLLPQWLRQGKYIKGFVYRGRCIDIGTPERYRSAQDLLANAEIPPALVHREDQL